jgi:hypothetical protein
MKHVREDYQSRIVDLDHKIGEDEPVFLLRGQDKCFIPMLQLYLWMTTITTQDVEIIKSIYSHIAYSEAWQTANKGKVKFADMPKGNPVSLKCSCGREFVEFEDFKYHLVECGVPSPTEENAKGVDAEFADGQGLADLEPDPGIDRFNDRIER